MRQPWLSLLLSRGWLKIPVRACHLPDIPLQELLLAYDVLQLDIPPWQLKFCLLLRAAEVPIGIACAVSCAQGTLCRSKPGAMALALLFHSLTGASHKQTRHALRCSYLAAIARTCKQSILDHCHCLSVVGQACLLFHLVKSLVAPLSFLRCFHISSGDKLHNPW